MYNPFAPLFEKLENIEQGLNGIYQVLEQKNGSRKDEFLNIQELSELIEESVPSIYTRTSQRTIPYYKKGKKLLFKRSEIIKWIESGKKKTIEEIQNEV